MAASARAPLPRIACAVFLAAGLGVFEIGWDIAAAASPSVARRTPGLLVYAAVLYGSLGALLALAAELLAWLLEHVRSSRPTGMVSAGMVSRGNAVEVHLAVWAGALVLGGLLLWLRARLAAQHGLARWITLLGITLAALIVAGLVLRSVSRLRLEHRTRARLRLGLLLSAVLLSSTGVGIAWAAIRDTADAARPAPKEGQGTALAARPNVVLVVVDTLRRDVLGCYGDHGGISPNVDAFARSGAVFERALAPAPWTLPSVSSLFTGLYPREHGFIDFDRVLPELPTSLPASFQRAGYHTRAAVGNVLMSHEKGFARHFELYDVYGSELEAELYASRVLAEVLRLRGNPRHLPRIARLVLRPRSGFPFVEVHVAPVVLDPEVNERLLDEQFPQDRPVFLYAHYTAPHRPYGTHSGLTRERWPHFVEANLELLRELYRREVAFTDAAFAELLRELEQRGVLENAIVVFTADHGEEFLEHGGWRHGSGLFEEVVGVPLILSGAGIPAGTRVTSPASLVDLAPTLLELCGIPAPVGFAGHSLLAAMRGDPGNPRSVFSETISPTVSPEGAAFGILGDGRKLIRRRSEDGLWIEGLAFDLELDPFEQSPLPELPTQLVDELETYRSIEPPDARDEGETPLERMRALGYVR